MSNIICFSNTLYTHNFLHHQIRLSADFNINVITTFLHQHSYISLHYLVGSTCYQRKVQNSIGKSITNTAHRL